MHGSTAPPPAAELFDLGCCMKHASACPGQLFSLLLLLNFHTTAPKANVDASTVHVHPRRSDMIIVYEGEAGSLDTVDLALDNCLLASSIRGFTLEGTMKCTYWH